MDYINALLDDPIGMLGFILLAFPGRIIALAAHEFAHAWMANRCGDPTARMLGRRTLNPLKHLDPIGTLLMLVMGFGWAKPVPVNPNNFRDLRRDDLKVSLAGVTMNLILFIIGFILMSAFALITLAGLPRFSNALMTSGEVFITRYAGEQVLVSGEYYYVLKDLFSYLPYVSEILITPALGQAAGWIYDMLSYFVQVNICLAVFNILPIPPLDGYHVFNDLILKRDLFASPKVSRVTSGLLYVLILSGVLGKGLGIVIDAVMGGMGSLVRCLLPLIL